MVKVYVRFFLPDAETDRTVEAEVLLTFTVDGLNDPEGPLGCAAMLKLTVPEKPPEGVTVTV
jgi:hypothetical protein